MSAAAQIDTVVFPDLGGLPFRLGHCGTGG